MSDPTVYAWDRERGDYVSDAGVRCSAPRVVGLDDYAALRRERNELRAEIAQHAMVIASWKREELDWHEDNRALLAENNKLRADALRYRWLRDRAGNAIMRELMGLCRSSEWDASIDAALREEGR